jgi:purine-binding chemotaxis protein CheW
MDIAKIRRKAKEQETGRKPDKPSEPQAAPSGISGEVPPETEEKEEAGEQAAPAEIAPAVQDKEEPAPAEPKEPAEGVPAGDDTVIELLIFRLASEEFAFSVSEVEEIIRFQKVAAVPTMPDYVLGITSLRGKIIPVIDLKARLNLKQAAGKEGQPGQSSPGEKILIIAGPKGVIGATVDRVIGVVSLPKDEVLEPPAHLTETEMKFIEGIVILDKRFISVVRAGDTMDIEI